MMISISRANMLKVFGAGLVTLLLIFLGYSIADTQSSDTEAYFIPQRVIVFGDSYSDNGNVYQLTGEQYPNSQAYYRGRFADGPVWAEYFAKLLHIDPTNATQFINLAYGQAKILSATSITLQGNPEQEYAIPSLNAEITAYQKKYAEFYPNDLVVVFISANDFFDIAANDPKAPRLFKTAADTLIKEIKRLATLNARHILVLNGRNVALSPLATLFAQKYAKPSENKTNEIEQYLAQFQGLIQSFNQHLKRQLRKFDQSQLALYDVFEFDTNFIHSTTLNTKGMCYQNSTGDYQHVAGAICGNPNDFFYYDRIHTTSFVNSRLAEAVYQKIKKPLRLNSDQEVK